MNILNYTTIEQGTHLLKAGLNPNTADMSYIAGHNDIPVAAKSFSEGYVPCWSVGSLIKLIWENEHVAVPSLKYEKESKYYVIEVLLDNGDEIASVGFSDITSAAINVIETLLGRGYGME